MIFSIFIDQVLSGRKTCTTCRGQCRYKVEHTYAVQRGRAKPSEGRILIEHIERVRAVGEIDQATAEAEGWNSPEEFREKYAEMHGEKALKEGAWRIWFRLVQTEEERLEER
jgi:hypothetical protein